MDTISKDVITELFEGSEGKAVSIYMPTFVRSREASQNPIRLKTLLNQAEDQFQQVDITENEAEAYLASAWDLVEDEVFWQGQDEGLALFLDANELRIYSLPKQFEELSIVADTFHITPLISLYQGNGPYYVLSLNQERPKIYQGSKFKFMQVEELDLPESLQEMFDEYYEFNQQIQFHGKTREPNPSLPAQTDTGGARQGMFFGQGGGEVNEKAEIRNFFHRFDEELADYLHGKEAPMILAGVGFLHPIYKEVNSYPNLVEDGVTKDVDHMPVEDLHEKTWNIVQDKYSQDVNQALGIYESLKDKDDDTTEDLEKIISSAFYKRIHTLFLAEDSFIWGKFDKDKNDVKIEDGQKPDNQDLLSLAAAHTLLNGGNVLVLPKEKIPGKAPAAAILRY